MCSSSHKYYRLFPEGTGMYLYKLCFNNLNTLKLKLTFNIISEEIIENFLNNHSSGDCVAFLNMTLVSSFQCIKFDTLTNVICQVHNLHFIMKTQKSSYFDNFSVKMIWYWSGVWIHGCVKYLEGIALVHIVGHRVNVFIWFIGCNWQRFPWNP